MSYYDNLTPEELQEKVDNVKKIESFLDLIIERNRMIDRGEINNPVYVALENEIKRRKEEREKERQEEISNGRGR